MSNRKEREGSGRYMSNRKEREGSGCTHMKALLLGFHMPYRALCEKTAEAREYIYIYIYSIYRSNSQAFHRSNRFHSYRYRSAAAVAPPSTHSCGTGRII